MQHLVERFKESVLRNPFAWVLFGMFVIAEYGNWQRGVELSRVCDLLGEHDVSVSNPRTARQEIDNICINRWSDD